VSSGCGRGAFPLSYDLKVVTHTEINPADYYTMSAAGVTHFHDGRADFNSLDQWEREWSGEVNRAIHHFHEPYCGAPSRLNLGMILFYIVAGLPCLVAYPSSPRI